MLVSKAEFARTCHVSRAAIGKTNLPLVDGKIDTESPEAVAYIRARKRADRNDTAANLAGVPSKMDKARRGGRPKRPDEIMDEEVANATSRNDLEIQKLKQQGINLELKNRQLRGTLANVKFFDEMFHTQLGAATKNFMALPNACVDGLMSTAISKGSDSRAEIVTKLTEHINEILEDVKDAWTRNYDRAESELMEIMNDD